MTKRGTWAGVSAAAVLLLATTASGCMMSANDACAAAWEAGPDEGAACEASDPSAAGDAPRDSVSGNSTGRRSYLTADGTGDTTSTDSASTDSTDSTEVAATAPRDASTGLSTGRRQHKPFTVAAF